MKKYKLPELIEAFDNFNNIGSANSQAIFTDLAKRATTSKNLSIVEANYYCQLVDLLQPVDPTTQPINVEDFEVCRNYHFRKLYLQYYNNLNGLNPSFDYKGRILPIEQKQKNIQYLDTFANEWENLVLKNNHKEEILNYVASEARRELKGLNQLPEVKGNIWGYNLYKSKKKAIVLHSKYIYISAKEIFESLDNDSFIYTLNDTKIEFNSYSLIHILSRHYAGVVKQYDQNKSFLGRNFNPRNLPSQLQEIFDLIDKSGLYANEIINFIPIKIIGQIHSIWTNEACKSIKGIGNIKYVRLQTLYPTKDANELLQLKTNYIEKRISEELSVYVEAVK